MGRDKTLWINVMVFFSVLVAHSNAVKLTTKGAKVVVLNDQGFFTSSNVTFKLQTCRQVDLLLATTRWNVEKRADYTFRLNVGVAQSEEKTTVLYSRKPQMTLVQDWSLCHDPIWLTVTVHQGHLMISESCNSRNVFKYQMDISAPIKYVGVSSSGEASWEIAKIPDCPRPGNVEKSDVKKSGFFQMRSLQLKTRGGSKQLVDYGFIRGRVQSLQLIVRGCDVAVITLCNTRRMFISETYTISLNERVVRANKTITRVRRCVNKKCSTLGVLVPKGSLDICKRATTFYLTVSKGLFSVGYKCDSKSGKSWKAGNLDQPLIGIYSKSKQIATDWIVMKNPCSVMYSLSAPPPKVTKLRTLGNNEVIYLKDKGLPASSSLVFQLRTCSHADLLLATTDSKLRSRNAEYTLRMNAGETSRRATFLYADGSESQMTLQQSRDLCRRSAWLMVTFDDGNLAISELCSPHKFRWPMDVNNTIMHAGVLSNAIAGWVIANMTKCSRKGSTNKRRTGANAKQGLFKLKSIQLKPNAHGRELNEHGFDLMHTPSLQLDLTTCDETTILISKPGDNTFYKIVINEYNKANKRRLTDIQFCKTFTCESVFKVTPNTSAEDCTQTVSYFLGLQQGMLGFGYSCGYEAGRSFRINNPFDTLSIRLESQVQNQKRPWKISANDCITNDTTQKRDGLGVDISNSVRKQHRDKNRDTKDLHVKLAMNKTEVTGSPQTQENFIGESSTRQLMSSIVRYDSSTDRYRPSSVRYDTSTGKYEASTNRYDASRDTYGASTGKYEASTNRYDASRDTYDTSTGKYEASTNRYDASRDTYDTSTGKYEASTGRYDPSTVRYDASTGSYGASTGRYGASTDRYDSPSDRYDASTVSDDASAIKYDASTVRYDASIDSYDPSSGKYDSTPRESPRLQETATLTPGNGKQVDNETNDKYASTSPPLPVDSSILEQTSVNRNEKDLSNISNKRNKEFNKSLTSYEMTVEYKSYSMSTTVTYDMKDIEPQGFKETTTRIRDDVKHSGTSEPDGTSHTDDVPNKKNISTSSKSESPSLDSGINTSSVVTNTTGVIPDVATPQTTKQIHTFADTILRNNTLTNRHSFANSSTEHGSINADSKKPLELSTMNIGKSNLEATTKPIPDNITQETLQGRISAETGRSKDIVTTRNTQSLSTQSLNGKNVKSSIDPPTFEPGMATSSMTSMEPSSIVTSPPLDVDGESIVTSRLSNTEPDMGTGSLTNDTSEVISSSLNDDRGRNATLSVPTTIEPDTEIESKKNVTLVVKSPSLNLDWKRTTISVGPYTGGATTKTGLKTNAKSVNASHPVNANGSVSDAVQSDANQNISAKSSADAIADEMTNINTIPATVKYKTEINAKLSKSNPPAGGPSVQQGKDGMVNPEHGDEKHARLLTSPWPRSVTPVFAPGAGTKPASGTTHSPSLQAGGNVTRNEQETHEGQTHRNTTMIHAVDKKSPRSAGCDIYVNVFIMTVLLIHL